MAAPLSFSFELAPPRTPEGVAKLPAVIGRLAAARPEYFSVTYGAGGSTQDGTYDTLMSVVEHSGAEAAAHLTCIGSTRTHIAELLARYQGRAGIQKAHRCPAWRPAGNGDEPGGARRIPLRQRAGRLPSARRRGTPSRSQSPPIRQCTRRRRGRPRTSTTSAARGSPVRTPRCPSCSTTPTPTSTSWTVAPRPTSPSRWCPASCLHHRPRQHRALLRQLRGRPAALDPPAPGAAPGRQAGPAGLRPGRGDPPVRNPAAQRRPGLHFYTINQGRSRRCGLWKNPALPVPV